MPDKYTAVGVNLDIFREEITLCFDNFLNNFVIKYVLTKGTKSTWRNGWF